MKVHYTVPYIINPQHPVTINLIGCGGNGSQMLMQLARINEALKKLGHVGIHVTCYDNDIVTEANLGRQLFSPSELGMNKAVAMITRVNRFFGLQWTAVPDLFTSKNSTSDDTANIFITCIDSIKGRKDIEAFKVKYIKQCKNNEPYQTWYYWMDLGNSQKSGQFIIGTVDAVIGKRSKKKDETIVHGLPTLFEKFPAMQRQKEKASGPSCSLAEALNKQDLFVNSILVQFSAQTLWNMFHEGRLTYQGAFINLQTLKIAQITI